MKIQAELSVLFATFLLCAISGHAANAQPSQPAAPVPVLLELFTSEGCSSCPPVDEWVRQLDVTQPIPGVEIVVLSEHVDYWNHDGWKDPFSSSLLTQRQNVYCQNFGLSEVYTPQLILDGTIVLNPAEPHKVAETIMQQAKSPRISISLESLHIDSVGNVLEGSLQLHPGDQTQKGQIFIAIALDRAESQVLAGENNGRHLVHVAVARQIIKVGKFERAEESTHQFRVKLNPGTDPANLRIIAFVQEPRQGKIFGVSKSSIAQSITTPSGSQKTN